MPRQRASRINGLQAFTGEPANDPVPEPDPVERRQHKAASSPEDEHDSS